MKGEWGGRGGGIWGNYRTKERKTDREEGTQETPFFISGMSLVGFL